MSRYSDITELFGTMVCDTLVPVYETGISCGLPKENGEIPPEMIWAPSELTKGRDVIIVPAAGDSMEGVGIHNGDWLVIELNVRRIHLKDILWVCVDGEDTLKSYMMDAEGRHWLVPSNDKYDAIQLTEDMDIRIKGRLLTKLENYSESTRNLHQTIERTLKKKEKEKAKEEPEYRELTYDEVVMALIIVGPFVKYSRSWLGACRVLMDHKFIAKDRYDRFCELVRSILPTHEHLPKASELRRMAVECFSKSFKEWKDKEAPVHGKYYDAYYETGKKMAEQF